MIYLAKDLTDDSKNKALDRNIKVELKFTKNLPFISRSQLFGHKTRTMQVKTTPTEIEYNTALKSKYRTVPTLADFKNGLVEIITTTDTNGNTTNEITDRFVPITIIPSMTTLPELQLYYDKVVKKYILIPSLLDVSENDTDLNAMSSNTIEVEAYYVGTESGIKGNINTLGELFANTPITSNNIDKLTDCKVHFLQDISDDGYQKRQNIGEVMENQDYLELMNMKTVFIVSLGSDSYLGTKLPLYKVVHNGFSSKSYFYIGETSVNDIAILLPL